MAMTKDRGDRIRVLDGEAIIDALLELEAAQADAEQATRDTFAAAALTGLISYRGAGAEAMNADDAFDFADAMMTERATRLKEKETT
jgi:hypothetical protein